MKCRKFDITIEPAILIFALSNSFASSGLVNLVLARICGHEHNAHNSTINSNATITGHHSNHAKDCINSSADLNLVKAMLKEVLPVISLIVAGYFRDKYGRTLPLFIYSASGQLLGTIVLLISAIYSHKIPVNVTVIVESTITGISGSFPLLLMTAACYISARTSVEVRTSRMSLILASYLGGMTIGFFLSGITLQKYGFMALFAVALVLAAIVLIYICLFIRETPLPTKKTMPFWVTLRTVFKKRKNNMRVLVLLLITIHCLFGTTLRGEANVFMLFVEKSLHLNVAETGIYSSYRSIILSISTFVVIPILSKYIKIRDALLGIICAALNCASAIWTAFARTKLQLFLCPLGDLLRGGIYAVEKSILTKCIGPNETGQIISSEYIIEAICHIAIIPLYTHVFKKTALTFPGAFFFISAVFSLFTFIIFCTIKFLSRNTDIHQLAKDENKSDCSSNSSDK